MLIRRAAVAVTEPMLIVLVLACARSLVRVCDAWAQRIVLEGLARWADSAPTGTQIAEQDPNGEKWQVRRTSARHGDVTTGARMS